MAGKIIANLIVLGGGIVMRAMAQAYRQALVNASKTGVASEVTKNTAARATKQMTLDEAEKILGIDRNMKWEQIMKRYDRLYQANEKGGTFYLQSKVARAKERLEQAQEYAQAQQRSTGS
eukprot:jgi/Chlat1/5324/Chrsp35S05203